MYKVQRIVILLFCLLIANCKSVVVKTPSISLTAPVIGFQTTPAIISLTPTSTKVINISSTSTLIPPTNSRVTQTIKKRCIKVDDALPSLVRIEGTLVLSRQFNAKSDYLLDITSKRTIPLQTQANKIPFLMSVSPNRQWLAIQFLNYDNNNKLTYKSLELWEANGHIFKIVQMKMDWDNFDGWVDNNHLLFSIGNSLGAVEILYNPFTGAEQSLSPSFHNRLDMLLYPRDTWWAEYNNQMTRVVYPSRDEHGKFSYTLLDLQTSKDISYLPSFDINIPKWSADGSKYLIAIDTSPDFLKDELFSVSINGEVKQLTHISTNDKTSIVDKNNYQWSPDGRYIAFGYISDPNQAQPTSILILDPLTGVLTDYCLPSSDQNSGSAVIWSPNEDQFIYESLNTTENVGHVILVDIKNKFAVNILDNLKPVGWMKNQP